MENFLSYARKETSEYGVGIILENSYYIKSGTLVMDGFFDGKNIVCATGKPSWLSTFVHEYSHFEQWIENYDDSHDFYYDEIDSWLQHDKELPSKKVRKYIRYIRDVELDCEKRSSNNIIKFKLPIDIDEYIQKANAYLYSYLIIETKRVPWVNQTRIWKHMPKHFNNNYDILPDIISRQEMLQIHRKEV